jgi:pilus assembly protein Flp/PilA
MTHIFRLIVNSVTTSVRRETAQTIAEYAILIAVIALVVIVAATLLGGNIASVFRSTAGRV